MSAKSGAVLLAYPVLVLTCAALAVSAQPTVGPNVTSEDCDRCLFFNMTAEAASNISSYLNATFGAPVMFVEPVETGDAINTFCFVGANASDAMTSFRNGFGSPGNIDAVWCKPWMTRTLTPTIEPPTTPPPTSPSTTTIPPPTPPPLPPSTPVPNATTTPPPSNASTISPMTAAPTTAAPSTILQFTVTFANASDADAFLVKLASFFNISSEFINIIGNTTTGLVFEFTGPDAATLSNDFISESRSVLNSVFGITNLTSTPASSAPGNSSSGIDTLALAVGVAVLGLIVIIAIGCVIKSQCASQKADDGRVNFHDYVNMANRQASRPRSETVEPIGREMNPLKRGQSSYL